MTKSKWRKGDAWPWEGYQKCFDFQLFSSRRWFPLPTKWVGKAKETRLDLHPLVSTAHVIALCIPKSFCDFVEVSVLPLESRLWCRCAVYAPLFRWNEKPESGKVSAGIWEFGRTGRKPSIPTRAFVLFSLFFIPRALNHVCVAVRR